MHATPDAAEADAYERALSAEVGMFSEGIEAWRFQMLTAAAPIGLLLGAERAAIFVADPTVLYKYGVVALLSALFFGAVGYVSALNVKSSICGAIAACIVEQGRVTEAVARRILRMKARYRAPLGALAVLYYAFMGAAIVILALETNLLPVLVKSRIGPP